MPRSSSRSDEEVHLEEHVAELVEQLGVVAGLGRVGQLVGLLDGVRDDRALVLLAVPRAFAAQQPRDLVEPGERGGRSALVSRQRAATYGWGCGVLGCCGAAGAAAAPGPARWPCGAPPEAAPVSVGSSGPFLHSATS